MSNKSKFPEKIMYHEGEPFEIRANMSASLGQFLAFGEKPLGKELSFVPLAYRIFSDELFKTSEEIASGTNTSKRWAEVFFLFEKNPGKWVVACTLFHNISVDQLFETMKPWRYEENAEGEAVDLTDLQVGMKLVKTTSKGNGNNFYKAEFELKLADADFVKEAKQYADTVSLYRRQTLTGNATTLVNVGLPEPDYLVSVGALPAPEKKAELPEPEQATA